MYKNLHDLILRCKNNDKEALLVVIKKFEPLINKYEKKSNYVDMRSELNLFLIELIEKIPIHKDNFKEDKYIISYIQKSLVHKYISISKKDYYKNKVSIEEITPVENYCNEFDNIITLSILENLTRTERKIIILKYYHNYSYIEIANKCRISRQAVNATKRRGLKKVTSYVKCRKLQSYVANSY